MGADGNDLLLISLSQEMFCLSVCLVIFQVSFFFKKFDWLDWLVGCRCNPIVTRGIRYYRWNALRGGLSKGSYPYLRQILEKTIGNIERLGRQAQPGIEPSTSRLPVFSSEPLRH